MFVPFKSNYSNIDDISICIEKCKNILKNNYDENFKFTVPSTNLYPHQWSWDSCWITYALSVLGEHQKAEDEIISLFNYQWKNGLVPSIVFHNQTNNTYFPCPKYWDLTKYANTFTDKNCTTGIIQPPLHSSACWNMYLHSKNIQFLSEIFPKLIKWHEYLYRERDPLKEGIIYIRHPWESGMDNSPMWDEVLEKIKIDAYEYSSKRTDNKKVNSNERPTDITYERYLKMIQLFKSCRFNEEEIYKNSQFIIQDVLFNTLLIKSNKDLLNIAKILKKDTTQIENWIKLTHKNFEKKFFKNNFYYDYDMKSNKHIFEKVIGGLSPIILFNSNHDILVDTLKDEFIQEKNENFKISSISRLNPKYDSINYWRGPTWINLTWLILSGLNKERYKDLYNKIKNASIQLVKNKGVFEYYDSQLQSSKGCGDNKFSWTAANLICMVNNLDFNSD